MKTNTFILAVTMVALSVTRASADPRYSIIGAALGGVAGAVVANNVNGISHEVGIPVGAIIGGIIGNQYNQRQKRHSPDPSPKTVVVNQTAGTSDVRDPHPGVDLIKVSILNKNGLRTDISLLRTGDRFVGPQGEQYDSLPTSAELARRYGM